MAEYSRPGWKRRCKVPGWGQAWDRQGTERSHGSQLGTRAQGRGKPGERGRLAVGMLSVHRGTQEGWKPVTGRVRPPPPPGRRALRDSRTRAGSVGRPEVAVAWPWWQRCGVAQRCRRARARAQGKTGNREPRASGLSMGPLPSVKVTPERLRRQP